MPLTILHAGVGAAAGAAAYALDRTLQGRDVNNETLGHAAMLGAVAGALPDILEPPTNRFHRKFFHSFTTLGTSAAVLASVHDNPELDGDTKSLTKALLASYMSHLVMDSRTPMGLPLLF